MENRLKNLISFFILFGFDIDKKSPKSIIDKFDSICNISEFPTIDTSCDSYLYYKKLWDIKDDYKIKNLYFLLTSRSNGKMVSSIVYDYNKYIGSLTTLSDDKDCIVLNSGIIDLLDIIYYKVINSGYYKEYIREIIINNIIK